MQTCLKSEQLSCSQIDDTGDLDRAQKGTDETLGLDQPSSLQSDAATSGKSESWRWKSSAGRPWHACTLRSHQMGENARCE